MQSTLSRFNKRICTAFVPRASSAVRLFSSLRAVHYCTKCFLLYRKFLKISYTTKKLHATLHTVFLYYLKICSLYLLKTFKSILPRIHTDITSPAPTVNA